MWQRLQGTSDIVMRAPQRQLQGKIRQINLSIRQVFYRNSRNAQDAGGLWQRIVRIIAIQHDSARQHFPAQIAASAS